MSNQIIALNTGESRGDDVIRIKEEAEKLAAPPETVGFLRQLIPNKADRERKYAELLLIKDENQRKITIFKLVCSLRIQLAEDRLNGFMAGEQGRIRSELTKDLMEQLSDLKGKMDESTAKFLGDNAKAETNANSISNPRKKEREIQRINESFDGYYRVHDKLMRNFEEIVDGFLKASPNTENSGKKR